MSRILITIDFPPEKGGIQRYLSDIVNHEYNDKDMVLVGGASDENRNYNLKCKVKSVWTILSCVNKKFSLIPLFFNLLFLRFFERKKNLEIEAGNVYAAIPVFIISLFCPVKYSIYCYGMEILPLRRKGLKSYILRHCLQGADHLYCISEYTAQLIKETGIEKQLIFIPPKIDIPENALKRQRDFFPFTCDKTVNLLSVGRLVEHKGHSVLIKAMQYLVSFNYSLTIAGTGPLKTQFSELIYSLDLRGNVEIKDKLSDELLKLEYLNSDIFILPSIESPEGVEGFGIVLLEAMLYRLPIIASRCGGIPEVLDNGNCGLLVEPGEPHMLADAILKLSNNHEIRRNLTETAFKRLVSNYAWK
jgi:phosphatidylinositol alpha-1,6-mannosyltransferase